ncbi:MAG: glycosyl transferase [Deltaproteobacteria bacterium GWB2_55_19]|nr:MAG: glycosyl transferase [Deltaproteobacteria bacterium GWB2_55_19]HAO92530.1 glycosyltransferase [Deltaproteobacteria bacterium]
MISIIIPVFNEGKNVEKLYERLSTVAKEIKDEMEFIFVDDGSRDSSLELIKGLNKKDPRVKAVSFSRNFGHQVAVSAGLRFSRGDAVIVIDGDLQDRPETLGEFISKWREGYQVVYAIRQMRADEGIIKKWTSWAFYRVFSKMVTMDIPLDSGDFCLMDRVVVEHLNSMPERNRFVRGLRSWIGYRQTGVVVNRDARHSGKAKYTFKKSFRLAKDAVIGFSHVPLHYIGVLGVTVAFIAFIASVFVIAHRVIGFKMLGYSPQDYPGYASLMLAVLFFGGVQLFALGILGEYIGRIFDETKNRPLFIAKEFVGIEKKEDR